MYTPDSVEQLQKAGLDFQKHEEYGILPDEFAELMITSGMVLNPETKWISFHRYVMCYCLSCGIPSVYTWTVCGDWGYLASMVSFSSSSHAPWASGGRLLVRFDSTDRTSVVTILVILSSS